MSLIYCCANMVVITLLCKLMKIRQKVDLFIVQNKFTSDAISVTFEGCREHN